MYTDTQRHTETHRHTHIDTQLLDDTKAWVGVRCSMQHANLVHATLNCPLYCCHHCRRRRLDAAAATATGFCRGGRGGRSCDGGVLVCTAATKAAPNCGKRPLELHLAILVSRD